MQNKSLVKYYVLGAIVLVVIILVIVFSAEKSKPAGENPAGAFDWQYQGSARIAARRILNSRSFLCSFSIHSSLPEHHERSFIL